MEIAVIGTGCMGTILGRALADAGHQVAFGSRPDNDDDVASDSPARIVPVPNALSASEIVILAPPGSAVPDLTAQHTAALAGKLVIDATNQMGQPVANARAALPATVRYARAFNNLGGENLANPVFADGTPDMFFSAPAGDRATVEAIIDALGLRPVYVGENQEARIHALFNFGSSWQ
jgi:8-hydroxy-5-deazaflavin:NADPH oxidoreductase